MITMRAMVDGFWLGVLGPSTLHEMDELYYDNSNLEYQAESWNRKGLHAWEEEMINSYFKDCKRLMLIGAGGGREVIALAKAGYEVDGFECHPDLVHYAQHLLAQDETSATVKLMERDICPQGTGKYDGLIVGWGTYMLIRGRSKRVQLLRDMRTQTCPNAPILISFFHRDMIKEKYHVIAAVGNFMSRIFNNPRVELGDVINPTPAHAFNKEEIAEELRLGGFQLVHYGAHDYGYAVGRSTDSALDN